MEDAQRHFLGVHDDNVGLTGEQLMGLQYYEDLQHPLTREDCEGIANLVVRDPLHLMNMKADFEDCLQRELLHTVTQQIDPDGELRFEICGSYRRGKAMCNDIDILVAFKKSDGATAHAEILDPLRVLLSVCK